MRKRLYIDVDGVLLRADPTAPAATLAPHAEEFLRFALSHFDCYWLTTHCRGDSQTVIDYLRPYISRDLIGLLLQVRATDFNVLKTDALEGDYLWIDDDPLATELDRLKQLGHSHRLIRIDTSGRPDDLRRAITILQAKVPR
jgi:hypothetical protein